MKTFKFETEQIDIIKRTYHIDAESEEEATEHWLSYPPTPREDVNTGIERFLITTVVDADGNELPKETDEI